jgi:hypothetical protein
MELGAVAKASVIIGGLALLAIGVAKIADLGKTAPPDIDKLSTSLKELASSGKFGGELKSAFGDVNGLVDDIKRLNTETAKSNQTAFGFRIPGLDDLADSISNSINNATKGDKSLDSLKGKFQSLDSAMASLASSGHADLAAKDFEIIKTAALAQGYSLKDVTALVPKYQAALSGLKGDQETTAQSMGLFGDKAVATQAALDLEAKAAQGLEQSIMALNAVHRGAYDAETAFYQAISDATKAVKANGHTLDVNTDSGRKNRDVLSQLAAKTEDLVDKKNKEHVAWDQVDKVYKQGRKSLIDTAMAMGDTKKQAQALANELLKAPNAKKLQVKVDKKAAESDLNAFNAAVKRAPGKKSVTLSTLSKGAEQVLTAFGYKVTHLKNGSVKVTAATGSALSGIQNVRGRSTLNGKTATTYVITEYQDRQVHRSGGRATAARSGGLRPWYAGGGSAGVPRRRPSGPGRHHVRVHPGVRVRGPGVELRVRRPGSAVEVRGPPRRAECGPVEAGRVREGRPHLAEKSARSGQLRGEFGISHFGKLAGYHRTPFEHGLAAPSDVPGPGATR